MNVTYGIMEGWPERVRNKQLRYEKIAQRALDTLRALKPSLE